MTVLTLQNVRKRFPNGTVAVGDFNLEVQPGELITLLGPSGCGKTTTLRCVAGLERPDSGRITVDDRVVFDATARTFVPPERRGLSMVFQQYALWPHMNVFDNVAFGLRSRKLPRHEVARKTERALRSVRLWETRDRQIGQMSGGQQQRIALARAIAPDPTVVLFDEPLSNLDVKLRDSMRLEIMQLQRQLGLTAIYVTHDQDEAFSLSSRIVVMNEGTIEQTGTPDEVWHHPGTAFVAGFVGNSTRLDGRIEAEPGSRAARLHTDDGIELHLPELPAGVVAGAPAAAFVRSGDIEFVESDRAGEPNVWPVTVELQSFHGDYTLVFVRLGETRLVCRRLTRLPEGDGDVYIRIDPGKVILYAGDTLSAASAEPLTASPV
jgi:ABC-type Fe3+/spermidine/putrescine transport system ATPase subunit